jgi:hypothetical protein
VGSAFLPDACRPPFRDTALPQVQRVDDLPQRLTLDERIALLHHAAPPVERLGVASFRTGTEALHGVAGEQRLDLRPGRRNSEVPHPSRRAAGSSRRSGARSPDRSSGGSRPCAAAPGTGSTCSAPESAPAGCRSAKPAARSRSTRRHQAAPSPTAAGRTRTASAPVPDVAADRAVRQPRRGPSQHEPRQHVGLELLQLLGRGRRPDIAQVPYDSQRQPVPLTFTMTVDRSYTVRTLQESRSYVRVRSVSRERAKPWPRGWGLRGAQ